MAPATGRASKHWAPRWPRLWRNQRIKRRAALQGLTRRLDSPYVFCDPLTGKRYRDVKRSFASACRRAGIEDFRLHDARHTFISQLVMAGADLMTVKELLGHKTLAMTLRYSHLAPSHKMRAVDLLDSALNEGRCVQSAR